MAINAVWHRAHPMPKNPTMDDRIRWHKGYAQNCGCRPIPDGVRKEIQRRAKGNR